jgi:hypothetical protein
MRPSAEQDFEWVGKAKAKLEASRKECTP